MNEPKISLIIPAYNEEKYIGVCLSCVIKNSGGHFFEIIVIDNASSDKTAEIAKTFPGVRVVREDKKGLTQARERGFREAAGNLLAYIDADTRLPEGWCKFALEQFKKNPKLVCLSGPYRYYDISFWHSLLVNIYWRLFAYFAYLILGYMVVGGNFVIRKDVLEKMKGFDTSIAFYGEDTDIARRASVFGKVAFKIKFFMPTSGRRFSGEGFFKTAWVYAVNFLSEAVFHKPATSSYKDFR